MCQSCMIRGEMTRMILHLLHHKMCLRRFTSSLLTSLRAPPVRQHRQHLPHMRRARLHLLHLLRLLRLHHVHLQLQLHVL